jgi:hypothetical protein
MTSAIGDTPGEESSPSWTTRGVKIIGRSVERFAQENE